VTSTAQTVTLTNTGDATLNFTSIVVTGTNAGDFTQTNNCGSSLTAGSNCTIGATFFPTTTETETAAVTITDNSAGGSPQTVTLTGTGVNSTGQFMTLDPTKTHLVNTVTNKPVFMTGEDAWDLAVQLDNADAATYLSDRASRGFNVIWVAAADNAYQSNPPEDYYGTVPFDGADFTNEDPTYWAHLDYIIQLAASKGITVALAPAFPGLDSSDGYLNSYLNSSAAVMTAYGAFLGNRYKSYPNIIWALGGDSNYNDSGLYAKINDLAMGIEEADSNHLITLEACPEGICGYGHSSTLEDWTSTNVGSTPTAMNLNWIYNQVQSVQGSCAYNYATYAVPALIGEDWYEGEHSMTELQLREELYQGVLSGCTLGQLFGNNAIWTMGGPYDMMGQTWQSQLGSQGSLNEKYNGQLMRSREFWKMVPDTANTYLTAGYGSGMTISVLSRTSDGQTMIAYVPNGNSTTITVNLAGITSSTNTIHGWWFNPSTAVTTDLGTFSNSGSRSFTPPDSNDWVLVLDDNGAHLSAPGSANL
jgi:hypothetical protein